MRRLFALLATLAVLAAACGGGGDGGGGDEAAAGCPVDALASATRKPVTITMWHVLQTEQAKVVQEMADAFNASQGDVRVRLVRQPSYVEAFTKWKAGLTGGAMPDVAQLEETTVQAMVDSRSTVTMQDCVDAAHYDLSDYLPATIDYYSTEGRLRAMPWSVSNPVLYYNRNAFERAGLDPDKPPTTFDEVKAYSQQLVQRGVVQHGIALKILPYYVEFWFAKAGTTLVDNGNGRRARATAANLDNPTGEAIYSWWKDMVDSGLALNVGTGTDPDHLYAIANGNAAMTIEASSVIGPIVAVLESGQFADLELGVGLLPGLKPGGGVPVGDGALWIPEKIPAVRKAAAWKWITYLNEPAQQAKLHTGAGYIPIRRSAVTLPEVERLWAAKPFYKVGYTQLESGPRNDATSGSVIGDYQGVRDAIVNSIVAMLSKNLSPKDALAQAQRDADRAIEAYNARVGA